MKYVKPVVKQTIDSELNRTQLRVIKHLDQLTDHGRLRKTEN